MQHFRLFVHVHQSLLLLLNYWAQLPITTAWAFLYECIKQSVHNRIQRFPVICMQCQEREKSSSNNKVFLHTFFSLRFGLNGLTCNFRIALKRCPQQKKKKWRCCRCIGRWNQFLSLNFVANFSFLHSQIVLSLFFTLPLVSFLVFSQSLTRSLEAVFLCCYCIDTLIVCTLLMPIEMKTTKINVQTLCIVIHIHSHVL